MDLKLSFSHKGKQIHWGVFVNMLLWNILPYSKRGNKMNIEKSDTEELVFFAKSYQGHQVMEGEMDGECNTQ
jgi:hypothetical protein